MNGEIQISDGLLHLRVGDVPISLDPIDTILECEAIMRRTKEQNNFEYLDEFAKWVKERCELEIGRGAAYAIWQAVHIEHARAQKSFTDALKSLTSTGSTPEA